MENVPDLDGMGDMGDMGGIDSIDGIGGIGGMGGLAGMDSIDGMDGMGGIDGIAGMAGMEGMEGMAASPSPILPSPHTQPNLPMLTVTVNIKAAPVASLLDKLDKEGLKKAKAPEIHVHIRDIE
jgi:hypothetical protein